MNVYRINEGEFPDISNGGDTDFLFVEDDDPEHAARQIVDLVKRRRPNAYRVPTSSVQVLIPMQRGVVGAANLNLIVQDVVNPTDVLLCRSGLTYRLHDKALQIAGVRISDHCHACADDPLCDAAKEYALHRHHPCQEAACFAGFPQGAAVFHPQCRTGRNTRLKGRLTVEGMLSPGQKWK